MITEVDAHSLAGDSTQSYRAGLATFVLGREAMVLILEIGGVESFAHVELYGPFPDAVAEALNRHRRMEPPVYCFARLPEGCMELGMLRMESMDFRRDAASGEDSLEACALTFRDRLPFDVLDRVRPTEPEPMPGNEWLDLLPHDAMAATQAFIDVWFAGVPPVSPDGDLADLPAPLAAFHRAAAGRRQVLGLRNRLLPAGELRRSDDLMIFGARHQGFELLMDPAEPDPVVYYAGLTEERLAEREPMSAYLLQLLLCEAAVAGPFTGFAGIDHQDLPRLVESLRRVPLRSMHWPYDPTYHYVGTGSVVMVSELEDWVEVYVGSRQRSALRPMRELGFRWQYFNG